MKSSLINSDGSTFQKEFKKKNNNSGPRTATRVKI